MARFVGRFAQKDTTVKILLPFLFAIGMLSVEGYRFGTHTTGSFVPVIESMLGQNRLANDFNILTHRFYHPNFNYLCSFFGRFVELPTLFFAGYFLCAWFLGYAIHRLAMTLFGSERIAALSMGFLLAWGSRGLEINSLWLEKIFTSGCIAWPMILMGAVCFLRRRLVAAALWLGLASVFHFQMGLGAFAALASAVVCDRPRAPKSLAIAALVYGVFFALLSVQHLPVAGDWPSGREFIAQAAFRMPHHFAFDPKRFLGISILLAVIFLGAGALGSSRTGDGPGAAARKRALNLACVIFVLGLAQYGDYYFLKWGFVARMQFLRLSCVIHLIGLICLCAVICHGLEANSKTAKMASLAIAVFGGPLLFGDVFARQLPVNLAAVLALGAAAILARLAGGRWPAVFRIRWVVILPLFLIVAKIFFMARNTQDYFVWDKRADLKDPWVKTCRWIGQNTPPNSRFITPPHKECFALYSRRATVAEFKVNPHTEAAIEVWRQRLRDLSGQRQLEWNCSGWGCNGLLQSGYENLAPERVLELGRRYEARFFITASKKAYPFKKLFSERSYVVYAI